MLLVVVHPPRPWPAVRLPIRIAVNVVARCNGIDSFTDATPGTPLLSDSIHPFAYKCAGRLTVEHDRRRAVVLGDQLGDDVHFLIPGKGWGRALHVVVLAARKIR